MEIKSFVCLRSFFRNGMTRFNSSLSGMFFEFGPVDSPPISMISAPCFSSSLALLRAFCRVLYFPPSLNESGVRLIMPMIFSRDIDIL